MPKLGCVLIFSNGTRGFYRSFARFGRFDQFLSPILGGASCLLKFSAAPVSSNDAGFGNVDLSISVPRDLAVLRWMRIKSQR